MSSLLINISNSIEDRFRQAKIFKVVLYQNNIRVILQGLAGTLEGIWGLVADTKIFLA